MRINSIWCAAILGGSLFATGYSAHSICAAVQNPLDPSGASYSGACAIQAYYCPPGSSASWVIATTSSADPGSSSSSATTLGGLSFNGDLDSGILQLVGTYRAPPANSPDASAAMRVCANGISSSDWVAIRTAGTSLAVNQTTPSVSAATGQSAGNAPSSRGTMQHGTPPTNATAPVTYASSVTVGPTVGFHLIPVGMQGIPANSLTWPQGLCEGTLNGPILGSVQLVSVNHSASLPPRDPVSLSDIANIVVSLPAGTVFIDPTCQPTPAASTNEPPTN